MAGKVYIGQGDNVIWEVDFLNLSVINRRVITPPVAAPPGTRLYDSFSVDRFGYIISRTYDIAPFGRDLFRHNPRDGEYSVIHNSASAPTNRRFDAVAPSEDGETLFGYRYLSPGYIALSSHGTITGVRLYRNIPATTLGTGTIVLSNAFLKRGLTRGPDGLYGFVDELSLEPPGAVNTYRDRIVRSTDDGVTWHVVAAGTGLWPVSEINFGAIVGGLDKILARALVWVPPRNAFIAFAPSGEVFQFAAGSLAGTSLGFLTGLDAGYADSVYRGANLPDIHFTNYSIHAAAYVDDSLIDNLPPIARIQNPWQHAENKISAPIRFDGTGSVDPNDAGPLEYAFTPTFPDGLTFVYGGLASVIEITAFDLPTFAGDLITYQLVVTDVSGLDSAPAAGVITFTPGSHQSGVAPVAVITPSVFPVVRPLDMVEMSGEDSYQVFNEFLHLSHTWSQLVGPTVVLSSTTAETVTFVAPAVTEPTTLIFQLVVADIDNASLPAIAVIQVFPFESAALWWADPGTCCYSLPVQSVSDHQIEPIVLPAVRGGTPPYGYRLSGVVEATTLDPALLTGLGHFLFLPSARQLGGRAGNMGAFVFTYTATDSATPPATLSRGVIVEVTPANQIFLQYLAEVAGHYLWSGEGTLQFRSQAWTGIGNFVSVSPPELKAGVADRRMTLSFSVADQALRQAALASAGAHEVLLRVIFSRDYGKTWHEVPRSFRGVASRPRISGGVFSIDVESVLGDVSRGIPRYWSHEDQSSRHAGDRGLEHMRLLASEGIDIIWPPGT